MNGCFRCPENRTRRFFGSLHPTRALKGPLAAVLALVPFLAGGQASCGEARASAPPVAPASGGPASEMEAHEFRTAKEVQQRLNDRYRGEDSMMLMTLLIIGKKKDVRSNRLLRYRKKEGGLNKTMLWFEAPADVRGTATLTLEVSGSEDLQRLYLPAMKKDRRIPAPDQGKSWMGTDFAYEDLREKKVDDWNYSPLRVERVEGVACYYYEMTPKSPDKSSYGRIESWVRRDVLELVKRLYYNKQGLPSKDSFPSDYRRFQDPGLAREVWLPISMGMKDRETGQMSVLVIERVLFNTGLDNAAFSPRAMTNLPASIAGGGVERAAAPLQNPFGDPPWRAFVKGSGLLAQSDGESGGGGR